MTACSRSPHGFGLVLCAAVFLAGCAAVEPWDRTVDGVQSVSDWFAEPVETGPFPSADVALDTVRGMEMGMWGVDADATGVGFVGDEEDGKVIGYARTFLPVGEHPLRAVDLRFEMRLAADGWWIGHMERRVHCAGQVATVDFCQ